MARRNALQRLKWCTPEQLTAIARNVGFDPGQFPEDADAPARAQMLYDWSRSVRGTGLLTLEAAIPWSVEPEISRQFEVQPTSGGSSTSTTSSMPTTPASASSPAPSYASASSTTTRPKPLIWDATPTAPIADKAPAATTQAPETDRAPAPVAQPEAMPPTSERVAAWMQDAPPAVEIPATPIAPSAVRQPASPSAPAAGDFNSAASILPPGSSSWSPGSGRSTVAPPGTADLDKVSRPETPHGLPAYGDRAEAVASDPQNNPESQETPRAPEHGGWWRKLLGK